MYIGLSIHICIFQLCPLGRLGLSDTSVATGTLSAQILVSKYHYPIKGTRVPRRKMADSRLRQRKYKMNLEYPIGPERKSVQKSKGWGHVKGHRS